METKSFPLNVRLNIHPELAAMASGVVAKDPESRTRHVIAWSEWNVSRGEGPFAAGVFDLITGTCVSAGVNRVVSSLCSLAHAEVMALMLAQQALSTYRLAEKGRFVLTTSAEPCAMCFGAIPWSGVSRVEYGATREDVEAIGFDEGPKPADWIDALLERDIEVVGPVLRAEAAAVLQAYAGRGGELYNG